MKKNIMLFVFLFMIMRLFGSDNFEKLPEELCVLIFKNLNTKNIFNMRSLSSKFNDVFEKNFRKSKQEEIEEYIKNLPQFWVKVAKCLKEGKDVKMPQRNFLREIITRLIKEFSTSEKPQTLGALDMEMRHAKCYHLLLRYGFLLNEKNDENGNKISYCSDISGFLFTHRLCGYKLIKCNAHIEMPFIYKSHCGNMALKNIKLLSWYDKMPRAEENILYNLLSNIAYCFKIKDPKDNNFCDPIAHFLPEFKNSVDPRAWFLYLNDLKEKKDPILENEKLKPLITWLEDEHKKDIAKHGFDVQKKLNNYLTKHCF